MFLDTKLLIRNWSILILCCLPVMAVASEPILSVSLLTIIDNPREFKDKRISVHGYLGGMNLHLFITEDHENMMDDSSSVAVFNPDMRDSALSEYCSKTYARVQGRLMLSPIGLRVEKLEDQKEAPSNVGLYWISQLEKIMVFDPEKGFTQCWPEDET